MFKFSGQIYVKYSERSLPLYILPGLRFKFSYLPACCCSDYSTHKADIPHVETDYTACLLPAGLEFKIYM